jgi:MFS family permease
VKYLTLTKTKALKLIFLFGLVSLLGDIIYEGARGVNGPYLEILGANAAIIGFVAGVGEFLGYGIRLLSGYYSDKMKAYWFFTILGYGLLFTIPLLSLAGIWQLAALFIISERMGKALRTPAKDTILSQATKQVGTGMGFAIAEVLDQIGAIIGPLIFTIFFFVVGTSGKALSEYQTGYSFLWVPFVLLIIVLVFAYVFVKKNPEVLEKTVVMKKEQERFSKVFWLYTVFSFVTTFGFVNFALIGYHLKVQGIFSDAYIPLLYAIAMGIDAGMALVIGKTYDSLKNKWKNDNAGLFLLLIIPLLTMFIPLLAFSMNYEFIIISAVIWGMVMGTHETIMKSAIADITPLKKRGTGYGIFSTFYGLAVFGGSVMVGLLYDFSIPLLIIITIAVEIIALYFFYIMWKNSIQK